MPRGSSQTTIELEPSVLRWARERVGFDEETLARKLRVKPTKVSAWETTGEITFAKVDALAYKTHTPVGFLYLEEPPDETLPITDFRVRDESVCKRPSPDLLETVYLMQRRQLWMRDELMHQEVPRLDFVGSFNVNSDPGEVASSMNEVLRLKDGWASSEGSWTDAIKVLRDSIDAAGVLVVFNGIVGNDTHRALDPDEFQGFALADDYAPLIFVNNADYKTAQIFTLAHELAHVFLSETGLSALENLHTTDHQVEQACNQIAAEFLVPAERLHDLWASARTATDPFRVIARNFKVSTVVAARRTLDTELISRDAFFDYYNTNKANNWAGGNSSSSGGNFWHNQNWRLGARFGATVMRAVKEGRLGYTEAYNLTGLRGDTFANMPEKMGFTV